MAYNPMKGGFPSLNIPGATMGIAAGDQTTQDSYRWLEEMKRKGLQIPEAVDLNDTSVGAAPMPEAIKPSAWGKGGRAWDIIGVIGDALATAGGGKATYMPQMLDMRKQVEEERRTNEALAAKAAAIDGLGLPVAQANALKANVGTFGDFMPKHNDTAADYEFWKAHLSPDDFKTYVQNKINPPQYRQGPDGNFYRVNVPAVSTNGPTQEDWDSAEPYGGSAPPPARPASETISQAEFMRLQQSMGPQKALNHIRSRNIQIGN
jgi:hypothetical protein